jgi:hypothetical protein
MQNTVPKITHDQQKTNFFPYSRRDVAGSGLLEKLKFVQWRVSETIQTKTENVNVIRLASLLAALPRMGIIAFNFSHNHMAKKFAELYGVPAPSRKSILNWEHTLQDLGYLQIPKHNASKSKTRVFTDEFWNLSRVGLPFLSHTSVPVTWLPTNGDKQVIPKDPTVTKNLETKKRAIDIDNKKEVPTRAPSLENKFSRPPKFDRKRPKKLTRFENSIMFWLFQNRELATYREGVILFAQFLDMFAAGDDYCRKLQGNWKDCRDASRPGMVGDLIRFLRSAVEFSGRGGCSNANPVPPLQILDSHPHKTREKSDPEIQKLLNTILWQSPYAGDHPDIIDKFREGAPDVQDRILDELMKGKIPVMG